MAAKGFPGFVVKFITYNNSADDPMSFASLMQEEPQIFSSEIGIDCTYVHIIVNKLRFINGSSHQQRIRLWGCIKSIIDEFIKNMFWNKTFEFGARIIFRFLILVSLCSKYPCLLKCSNIYTFLIKMLYLKILYYM